MQLLRLPAFVVILAPLVLLAGCGLTAIDVASAIKIGNITTGWFDAGVTNGMNKLVPSASFTVSNTSSSAISSLQVFSVFRYIGENEELGSSLVILHGADALGPNATSKPLTVRGVWGFTGQQPRAQMLMHKLFKDARVEIFAKYGAGQFIKLTDVPVRRQLLTH
ncbi:MAG: hypothetical protein NT151_08510 [Acidobacteria bacterium]|nr:hypothetical protein [Acidobacteriota bacterium]